jgi:hypothetical protein
MKTIIVAALAGAFLAWPQAVPAQWVNDRCSPECDSVKAEPADPFGAYPAYHHVYVRLPNAKACPLAALSLDFAVFNGNRVLPTLYESLTNNDWLYLAGVILLVDGERIVPQLNTNFTAVRKVLSDAEVHEEASGVISLQLLRRLGAAREVQVRFQGETSWCDTTLPDASKPALTRLAQSKQRPASR